MKKNWIYGVLVLTVVLVWTAAHTINAQSQQRLQEEVAQPEVGEEMTFLLYYGDKDVMKLLPEERTVTVPAGKDPLLVVVEELTKEPTRPDALLLMPLEVKILSVDVEDNIITINFNEKLRENFYGGSSSEALLVASIVDTVTELDDYRGYKVGFLMNGESFESIGGHISAEELFERSRE